tara:strand:+ start:2858 stop:3322 length:465 start_codon:yes stop_codon:yes gene_type:complete
MSDKIRVALICLILAVGLFGEKAFDSLSEKIDNSNTAVNVDEPSLENKDLVKDIVAVDFLSDDAELVSEYFIQLADVVERDDNIIESTGQFANFNLLSGVLYFDSTFADRYDNLGEMVEEAVENSVGLEDVSLTPDKRESLVETLRAIAWGVNQ